MIGEDIRDFLLKHGRDAAVPYAELERMVAAEFGPERALRQSELARFFKAEGGKPYPTKLDKDAEVAAWVRDRAGTMPLDALRAACIEAFGERRAPSIGVLMRYLKRFVQVSRLKPARRTRIGGDADLRALLESEVRARARGSVPTLDELRARCLALFGEERTPSRATIHRAMQALRTARGTVNDTSG